MTRLLDESRRSFLRVLVALPAAWFAGLRLWGADEVAAAEALLASSSPDTGDRKTRTATPTPDCDDGDEPTPSATAGPFFTPNSPERGSLLEKGMKGTRVVLTGHVVTVGC